MTHRWSGPCTARPRGGVTLQQQPSSARSGWLAAPVASDSVQQLPPVHSLSLPPFLPLCVCPHVLFACTDLMMDAFVVGRMIRALSLGE